MSKVANFGLIILTRQNPNTNNKMSTPLDIVVNKKKLILFELSYPYPKFLQIKKLLKMKKKRNQKMMKNQRNLNKLMVISGTVL